MAEQFAFDLLAPRRELGGVLEPVGKVAHPDVELLAELVLGVVVDLVQKLSSSVEQPVEDAVLDRAGQPPGRLPSEPLTQFGAVVIEQVFGLPGLGAAMLNAVSQEDFPVVQGVTLVFALVVVFVQLFCDILYTVIDPRIEIR